MIMPGRSRSSRRTTSSCVLVLPLISTAPTRSTLIEKRTSAVPAFWSTEVGSTPASTSPSFIEYFSYSALSASDVLVALLFGVRAAGLGDQRRDYHVIVAHGSASGGGVMMILRTVSPS